MELKNANEDLSFDLSASSGTLRALGTAAKKNLRIDKGGIIVNGRSLSGSQDYY